MQLPLFKEVVLISYLMLCMCGTTASDSALVNEQKQLWSRINISVCSQSQPRSYDRNSPSQAIFPIVLPSNSWNFISFPTILFVHDFIRDSSIFVLCFAFFVPLALQKRKNFPLCFNSRETFDLLSLSICYYYFDSIYAIFSWGFCVSLFYNFCCFSLLFTLFCSIDVQLMPFFRP